MRYTKVDSWLVSSATAEENKYKTYCVHAAKYISEYHVILRIIVIIHVINIII